MAHEVEIYSWHGTRIPSEWINDKKSLTPETALTWENIEQRRCAAEIIGWDKVLEKIPHTVIDDDEDKHVGTLLEAELPDIGKGRFLKVLCGTGRTFCLPVESKFNTALEANASLGGWQPSMKESPENFIPFYRS